MRLNQEDAQITFWQVAGGKTLSVFLPCQDQVYPITDKGAFQPRMGLRHENYLIHIHPVGSHKWGQMAWDTCIVGRICPKYVFVFVFLKSLETKAQLKQGKSRPRGNNRDDDVSWATPPCAALPFSQNTSNRFADSCSSLLPPKHRRKPKAWGKKVRIE